MNPIPPFTALLGAALAQFNLAGPAGLTGWRMTTRAEATTLYSARGSSEPWVYLHDQGIYTVTDDVPNFIGVKTLASYWTSDACPNGLPCVYNPRTAYTGNSVSAAI